MSLALTSWLASPIGASLAVALHLLGALGLVLYGTGQAHLLWLYWRRPGRGAAPPLPADRRAWPRVTVQVPMYNERYVAADVIDACAQLDWPREQFELQLLDDSDDDTRAIVDERAAHWRAQGVNVQVVRRAERVGFKAGALAHGVTLATGDFHCLFDADFQPPSDFLTRAMGWFADPAVGAVQCRWEHLNRDYNWLTRAQALIIDAFFLVEQEARDRAGLVLRFNGSAGIWRAAAVADSGGWQADTLSEDYDLCLRAQLRGWRFVFARDVVAPAELPVTVHDYKVQQARWACGRGQVIRKLMPALWRASWRPLVRTHALFDMLNILVVPSILLLTLTGPWMEWGLRHQPWLRGWTTAAGAAQLPFNAIVLPAFLILALTGAGGGLGATIRRAIRGVPAFVCTITGINMVVLSSGLSGVRGGKPAFKRTSKYKIDAAGGSWRERHYRPSEVSPVTWAEGGWALFGLFALAVDLLLGTWFWVPFHTFVTLGFGLMFARSLARA